MVLLLLVAACSGPLPATPSLPPADAHVVATVRDGDVVHLVDRTGARIGAGSWTFVGEFADGVAPAAIEGTWDVGHRGGRWGVIDKGGRTVVPFEHGAAELLGDGLVAVRVADTGKWGVIDLAGHAAIEPAWDGVRAWGDGLLAVNEGGHPGRWDMIWGGRWGVVDRDGAVVIAPAFGALGRLSQGLATARMLPSFEPEVDPAIQAGSCPGEQCPSWGYVDRSGAWVIQPAFQEANPFEDGRARVYDGSYRYVDATGGRAGPSFRVIGEYGPEGLAYVMLDDGTRGYADRDGKVVHSGYDDVEPYAEGRAAAQMETWGFLDAAGAWAIRPRYAEVEDFQEGLAAVRVGGPVAPYSDSDHEGRWGFVGPQGQAVVAPKYAEVRDFRGGLAPVAVLPPFAVGAMESDLRWGLVDRDGNEVVAPVHDGVTAGGW